MTNNSKKYETVKVKKYLPFALRIFDWGFKNSIPEQNFISYRENYFY